MKQIRFYSVMLLSLVMGASLVSCGSSSTATKQEKQSIVLQEGDNATVTVDEDYTTITLPTTQTADQMALYETDIKGYLLKSNAPISNDGSTWESHRIYYYVHNSKEWLHKGVYEHPMDLEMSKVKSIRVANRRKRLRDFADEMGYLVNSNEKKNDQGFQDELAFGNSYYIFVDITLK